MRIIVIAFIFVLAASIGAGTDDKPRVWFTTLSGEKFDNVILLEQTPIDISVQTATGVIHVPMTNLPPEVRAKLGYDAAKAQAYAKAMVQAAQERAAQAQERVDEERRQAASKSKSDREARQAQLDYYQQLDQAVSDLRYQQEMGGVWRERALKEALREKYLSGGK